MTVIRGEHRIAEPKADKPALHSNVFHASRSINSSLSPLFPYTRSGDIVPCATIFWGGEGRDTNVFNHMNTVDEVAICFASEKARMPSGFVHVGSRKHLVGRFFENQEDPEIMMSIVVTQRQAPEGQPQRESYTFICENCQEPLLHYEFSAKAASFGEEAGPGFEPPLETLTEGAICLEPFNADETQRTCTKCGTVNLPFPIEVWGWDSYYKNTLASEKARRILDSLGNAVAN